MSSKLKLKFFLFMLWHHTHQPFHPKEGLTSVPTSNGSTWTYIMQKNKINKMRDNKINNEFATYSFIYLIIFLKVAPFPWEDMDMYMRDCLSCFRSILGRKRKEYKKSIRLQLDLFLWRKVLHSRQLTVAVLVAYRASQYALCHYLLGANHYFLVTS